MINMNVHFILVTLKSTLLVCAKLMFRHTKAHRTAFIGIPFICRSARVLTFTKVTDDLQQMHEIELMSVQGKTLKDSIILNFTQCCQDKKGHTILTPIPSPREPILSIVYKTRRLRLDLFTGMPFLPLTFSVCITDNVVLLLHCLTSTWNTHCILLTCTLLNVASNPLTDKVY